MKIKAAAQLYLKHLKTIGRAYYTIKSTRYGLKSLATFLEDEQVRYIEDLNRDVLEDYQEDLSYRFTAQGTPLGRSTREKLINVAQGFTRYLKHQDYLLNDPGETLTPPKRGRRLPKSIMSHSEVKQLLNAPDRRTSRGQRDRIILQILYDTGIRRSEMARMRITDLDLDTGYIRICGKGDKDRVVPVSEKVCELIQNYLLFVRPAFVKAADPGHLVLNRSGKPIAANGIYIIVKTWAKRAGIKKKVTTHSLRHTCATHMLKNGAPVRHIQEMLGHESLESTQIYTHVTINDLKQVHAKYHPSQQTTP